ncbi:MAG: hypothetical protein Q4G35_10730 [Propionibacteriaceae bacterium]|nr:hypothetical protein [Propionibacteriaceae bacterium]
MTLYTPVVFSNQDPDIERAAMARGWRVVEQESVMLRLIGTRETMQMPTSHMNIQVGAFEPAHVPGWNAVIAWLRRHVANPLLVMGPNHGLTDLALWAHAAHGIPHGAWLTNQIVSLTSSALALLSSASGVVFTDSKAEATFRASWPTPLPSFQDSPLVELVDQPAVPPALRTPGVTRVLLVGYYAGPSPTVGVQRINYWFNNLARLSEGRVQADLVMATAWPDAPERAHVVPDMGPAEVFQPGGAIEPWGLAHVKNTDEASKAYSVTGGYWPFALQRYFDAREDEYDVVIISGNPFSYFEFARYAKQRWYAATILDYRDPFSRSPRLELTPEQLERATHDEATWNFAADMITVVNSACAELVVSKNAQAEIEIIPNGWDDTSNLPGRNEERAPHGQIRLTHAGQWYEITHPADLIEAVAAADVTLHQFGPDLPSDGVPNVLNHGRRGRTQLYGELATMHCGVTFSSAQGFETPTKVFDYLALGLDILVLHDGAPADSALHALLGDTEGIHWVENDVTKITEFLSEYQPTAHTDPARAERFSRAAATRKLISHIEKLGDHSYFPPAALTVNVAI